MYVESGWSRDEEREREREKEKEIWLKGTLTHSIVHGEDTYW